MSLVVGYTTHTLWQYMSKNKYIDVRAIYGTREI